MICAEGSQRTLVSSIVAIPVDAPSVAATIVGWQDGIGLSRMALADTGFASGEAAATLGAQGSELLVAISQTQPH